jgi:mono/diheme cytochrome c family protein/plastocyanin
MTRVEGLARFALLMIMLALPAGVLGYQYGLRPTLDSGAGIVEIRAYAPEYGGFSVKSVNAVVGQPVTLRFTAMDVVHGIAIGPGLGIDLGPVDPGKFREVTLTFDTPGTYTYYCTTWCSADHWRMRGVIEVRDPSNPDMFPPAQIDPVIERLIAEGIDIDARVDMDALAAGAKSAHGSGHSPAEVTSALTFSRQPSASRGEVLFAEASVVIPDDLHSLDWQRTHTPGEALDALHAANPGQGHDLLADAVAYLWTRPPDETARGIYNANCAACHGEFGSADGPASLQTASDVVLFSDPVYMFTMRGDVLYAKIRRGGMGTDMPNFGTLFTPEETWALVDYLWSLTFEHDRHVNDR